MASLRKLFLASGMNEDTKTLKWPQSKYQYDVWCNIGYGGYAKVVLATCRKNQQPCAIKQIDMSGSSIIERTLREIRLMSKLKHPNIISLNAAFVYGNEIWIVENFFPLGSLEDVMVRGSNNTGRMWAFGERSIASILKDVLVALEHLHKHGFIHNDIKPGNIFLKHDGTAVLADLGGAKSVKDKTPGIVITAAYKAPEINRGTRYASFRSDIWSMGITALVLHGAQDLITMTFVERVRAVVVMNFPGMSQLFRRFLKSTLAVNPNERAPISILLEMDFLKHAMDKKSIADLAASHLD